MLASLGSMQKGWFAWWTSVFTLVERDRLRAIVCVCVCVCAFECECVRERMYWLYASVVGVRVQ